MPRGDRTGPAGQGPRTGRGIGYCVGNEYPGYMSPDVVGEFLGRVRGFFGRGGGGGSISSGRGRGRGVFGRGVRRRRRGMGSFGGRGRGRGFFGTGGF